MKTLILTAVLIGLSACDGHYQSRVATVQGDKGADGSSCSVSSTDNGAIIKCTDGTSSIITNGSNGEAGKSCTSSQVTGGVSIQCGADAPSFVSNGAIGATGANGQNASGIYITEVINPCGAEFANEEIFLRLSNNSIIAVYDGGVGQNRLAALAPGQYMTTDNNSHSCTFTVTSSLQITNQARH